RGVTIARNRFRHFGSYGGRDMATLGIAASGMRPLVERVDIVENTFIECTFSINVVVSGATEGAIRDTRIVRNTVLDAVAGAISIELNGPAAIGGSITRTLIAGNRFSRSKDQAVVMWGGLNGASGNTVSSVWFHNNIVDNYPGGVFVIGGMGGSRNNRVENVQIANSTFYGTERPVSAQSNAAAADVGNTFARLDIRNSIFWNSQHDFWNEVLPEHVSFSITTAASFVGTQRNFSADPLFVAPQTGDFRLQAGSPAIDKGTADLAPTLDMFCRPRLGAPDLGALEFGALQSICSTELPMFPLNIVLPSRAGELVRTALAIDRSSIRRAAYRSLVR
ncbi:MAG: choice-of-anchor Q domain-containing protein, partial [Gemmatimonadaceae bacterium]